MWHEGRGIPLPLAGYCLRIRRRRNTAGRAACSPGPRVIRLLYRFRAPVSGPPICNLTPTFPRQPNSGNVRRDTGRHDRCKPHQTVRQLDPLPSAMELEPSFGIIVAPGRQSSKTSPPVWAGKSRSGHGSRAARLQPVCTAGRGDWTASGRNWPIYGKRPTTGPRAAYARQRSIAGVSFENSKFDPSLVVEL